MKKLFSLFLILSLVLTAALAEGTGVEKAPMTYTTEEIYQAALEAHDAGDYARAAAYYELAAARGHAKSQNNLACLYEDGLGVEQSNEKAMEYYKLAADQGLAGSQYNLALKYENGDIVEQDYEKALEYYRLAADQDHPGANNNLGDMYAEGRGVEQDYARAMEYYQKALDLGLEFARVSIGDMYEKGLGVEQSLEKAVECYREAADKGEEAAVEQLDRLVDEGKLLAYALPTAEKVTKDWLCELNRSSIANMSFGDGPIYVIGHRSPDTDTICSAIAYARLLNMLGYPAEAAANGLVNHETAFILKTAGLEPPKVLEDAAGESIFLVDHSEYAQSTEDLVDAHIVGVLDHHGIGSISTGHQVVYEAKPIGATATIIWLDYLNYGLEIDKPTATLLLGAVLSDTMNLTSMTVTEADRQAVVHLAEIAGIEDVNAFFQQLHAEALSYDGMSDEDIFFSDYKEYEVSGVRFGIGLLSVIDEDHAREMAERMKDVLPEAYEAANVELLYACVGIREGDVKTDFIVPCDGPSRVYFESAFPNCDEFDGTSYIFRNGGLGRKTKFVPGLTDYLNAHPHD